MLAYASHRHQPNARDNRLVPCFLLQAQNNRCVCVIDVVVVVVVVVVVLVTVSVVVVLVVAAAVVFDVSLFGCESRSASNRPCEWLHAMGVDAAVVRRCSLCRFRRRFIVAAPL